MTTYVGLRDAAEGCLVWRMMAPLCAPLNPRLDLRRHSPTGFEWGYGGSGPAQLALAILADVTGDDEVALRLYMRFKFGVVSGLPKHGFLLPATDVEDWIIRQIAKAAPPIDDDGAMDLGESKA